MVTTFVCCSCCLCVCTGIQWPFSKWSKTGRWLADALFERKKSWARTGANGKRNMCGGDPRLRLPNSKFHSTHTHRTLPDTSKEVCCTFGSVVYFFVSLSIRDLATRVEDTPRVCALQEWFDLGQCCCSVASSEVVLCVCEDTHQSTKDNAVNAPC